MLPPRSPSLYKNSPSTSEGASLATSRVSSLYTAQSSLIPKPLGMGMKFCPSSTYRYQFLSTVQSNYRCFSLIGSHGCHSDVARMLNA